jgi:hypothetical protein
MSRQLKRNNSVPHEIDRLPEIQSARRKENQPPPSSSALLDINDIKPEKRIRKHAPVVLSKALDDSFKKNSAALDIIKEDRGDDDYCMYNDDFEGLIPDEEEKYSLGGGGSGSRISKEINQILDVNLNPRSAEPHLHKSKIKNLIPLQELCN